MLSRLLTRKEQLVLVALAASICLGALALYAHGRPAASVSEGDDPAAVPIQETAIPLAADPPKPEPVEESPPAPEPDDTGTIDSTQVLAVSAAGAVKEPGLYRMMQDARVQDLIDFAGGPTEDANLTDINLAASLIDGSTLTIPHRAIAHVEGGALVLKQGQSAAELNPPEYTISGWRMLAAQRQAAAPAQPPQPTVAQPGAAQVMGGIIDLNTADAATLESLPGIGPKLAGQIIEYRKLQPFQSVDDLVYVSGIGEKKLEAVRSLVTVR